MFLLDRSCRCSYCIRTIEPCRWFDCHVLRDAWWDSRNPDGFFAGTGNLVALFILILIFVVKGPLFLFGSPSGCTILNNVAMVAVLSLFSSHMQMSSVRTLIIGYIQICNVVLSNSSRWLVVRQQLLTEINVWKTHSSMCGMLIQNKLSCRRLTYSSLVLIKRCCQQFFSFRFSVIWGVLVRPW